MILIIDNYDSFVHNLARYVREDGAETLVVRNDTMSVEECLGLRPSGVIISPGPKRPRNAGISMSLLEALPAATPLLGVCLGHQCLVESFGGKTVRAHHPVHGEARAIHHEGGRLFQGIPSPSIVGRYHSLVSLLPEGAALSATAWSEEKELMAVAHKDRPWFGVQFHPESLLTLDGRALIHNFITLCGE